MNHSLEFKEMILRGIQDLSEDSLQQIAEFVFFIRKKNLEPEIFAQEFEYVLHNNILNDVDNVELKHLEDEFSIYQNEFPKQ
ncbi:MAG: hypothetical protein MUE85_02210 [Microscillaceae bacterium]|jgi:hypothetical protein|nr:hypothetical protein [Microscillaceae bacterium]